MVQTPQAGPDVSEGGTDARQGILLLRLQKYKMGLPELLLGREHYWRAVELEPEEEQI